MRVQIEGERRFMTDLAGEFAGFEKADAGPDMTEQKFGFAEAAAIVAIVQGVAELAQIIKRHLDKRAEKGDQETTQTLRLKSAVGTVVVEVTPDTTVEQLQQALTPLTPTR